MTPFTKVNIYLSKISFPAIEFLYVLTDPEASLAINVIRAGAIARIIHTLVYLNGWQPLRFLSYFVGSSVTAYMSYKVIMFFK